jgi:hypothetical protein
MTKNETAGHQPQERRPWYREPWPWVAIGIPAVAVVGGLFTLYLAITHPDPLVVDEGQYQEIRSGLQAQPQGAEASAAARNAREDSDGEH